MRVMQSKCFESFRFLTGQKTNGSCSAQYVIDTDLLSHMVHATRPIAEGEEITISCKDITTHTPSVLEANVKRHLSARSHLSPPAKTSIWLPLHLQLSPLHFSLS
jgi:hypothetical protein